MAEDPSAIDLAESRTDLAEGRTVLANERTFAGWVRTGLASIGIGIGFNALFGKLEPGWMARGIASLFILTGIGIFYLAQRNSRRVLSRLKSQEIGSRSARELVMIALATSIGGVLLLVGIWTMKAL